MKYFCSKYGDQRVDRLSLCNRRNMLADPRTVTKRPQKPEKSIIYSSRPSDNLEL